MNKYEEAFDKFDLNLQEAEVHKQTNKTLDKYEKNNTQKVLKLIHSCIDLTSLNTDDNKESIWRLTQSVNDFENSNLDVPNVAAICVYPNFISVVKEALTTDVLIAAVAGGFPSSQTFPEIKAVEAAFAVAGDADEIDIVLNIGAFFEENWEQLCLEIEEIKAICSSKYVCLKVILETGLLKTPSNIRKAAILAMYSGADFIKTSTGKVYPGATPDAVYVICQTIKEYYRMYQKQIGIKVSGAVRSVDDAVKYYTIVKEVLGEEWLCPDLFRIGASSLAEKIMDEIC